MKLTKEQIAYVEENLGKNILPLSIFENTIRVGTEPIEVLLFYKKVWTVDEVNASFLKAAQHFNLFSSRLIMIGDNEYALQYCTDAVDFHELPPIDDTFNNLNIDEIKKKIVKVKTLPGESLLSLTVIPLKDGKLGGVSCSHAIGDGVSVILFLALWGCVIEGKDLPIPSNQRLFTGKPISSDKIDKVFTPPLSELSVEIQDRVKSGKIETYIKRDYFSEEFINEIKNKAKSENEKFVISGNQIITASLIKKYYNDILPDTDIIRLRSPINLRDIRPDLDPMYIGNAYFDSITEFTKVELEKISIPQIGYRLKESIIEMRNEKYIKEIAYLSKYGIQFNADMMKNYSLYNIDTDIVSSNLTHLNDLATLGIGEDKGSFVYVTTPVPTGFLMLREQSGRIFVDITSRYQLT
jgi:hypothetical protein